ncbi:MAG: peptidoglycan-associated lipoprotein [Fluviicola sp. XM-24bin1]|nr:MAG: peptidoglycan-associated lipoprotein [Fluviicola sp. XM-24bin1]
MKTLVSIVSFFVVFGAMAQNVEFTKDNFKDKKDGLKAAIKSIETGDEYFEGMSVLWKDAIPHYLKANEFNPNNAMLNFKLGACYLQSLERNKALGFLEKAYQLNPSVEARLNYYLGQAYHLNYDFDDAIKFYSKYKSVVINNPDPWYRDELDMRIQQCYNGKKIIENPIRVFIDNLGGSINTQYREYGAVISADESVIIFTSRRVGSTGGKIDPTINEHFEDLYISYKQEDGSWSPAENLGDNVNSDDHDAVAAVSADGQRVLIFLGRKNNAGDLYECTLDGDVWSKPESLGKNVNTKEYHESSACYSPDGNTIYFVTNKPGGIGDHDIYMTQRDEKGKWGPATNLGTTINTKYDEEAVYMHPDGKTLYFSSKGHTSIGGYDIFKSVYDEATQSWGTPENLGYPVNTADDDAFFVLSADGKRGYFTSGQQADNKGTLDLYMITFLGPEKPMVLNNEDNLLAEATAPIKERVIAPVVEVKEAQLTILKGLITDFLSKEPLEAQIEIVDNEANQTIATFKSNSKTGRYLVSLPAGKNYGIAVKKDGYLFHSENFDIPATAAFQEVEKNIELKQLAVGSKIVLRNIFFDLDKATLRPESTAELQRLIKLMNDVPTLNIELGGHTDSRGSDSYNMDLSKRRAKAVVDYLTKNGIDAGRLKWEGYGETQLVNKCANGVNCSDEDHQMNRRTEFKVLSF